MYLTSKVMVPRYGFPSESPVALYNALMPSIIVLRSTLPCAGTCACDMAQTPSDRMNTPVTTTNFKNFISRSSRSLINKDRPHPTYFDLWGTGSCLSASIPANILAVSSATMRLPLSLVARVASPQIPVGEYIPLEELGSLVNNMPLF